jgi:hypothetical protein
MMGTSLVAAFQQEFMGFAVLGVLGALGAFVVSA